VNYLKNTMFISSFYQYRRFALLLVCAALLASCDRLLSPNFESDIQEVSAGQFTLDPDHATLIFKINHLGFSTYIGRFNTLDASLDFDPENIENSSLEVIVDVTSLDINNAEFAQELLGSAWFDAENFPQAVFRTTRFVEANENSFTFEGDLTLKGTTAPVTLNANFHGAGINFLTRRNTVGFSGSANFKRSEFGMERFTSFGVGDDIELEIHVEFQEAAAE